MLDLPSKPAAPQPLRLKRQLKTLSLAAYVRQEARQEDKHEFHDGILVKKPYTRGPHNEITLNITFALKTALRNQNSPVRLFSGDQKIYLPEVNFGLYPDVVALSGDPVYWDDDTLLLINPPLVVEVLSRSTGPYDRSSKFDLYKTRPTFQEYMLVRQDAYEVETRYREAPGLWRETVTQGLEGEVHLRSLACSIRMADIYEHIRL